MWRPEVMVFVFLAVGAVALFSFLGVASWSDARRKERESYYKNDMLKRLAEAQGPGAASAVQLLREEARLEAVRRKQGLKIGGLVLLGTGLGLMIFLRALIHNAPIFLCGLLVLLIGGALYAASYVVTVPEEEPLPSLTAR